MQLHSIWHAVIIIVIKYKTATLQAKHNTTWMNVSQNGMRLRTDVVTHVRNPTYIVTITL